MRIIRADGRKEERPLCERSWLGVEDSNLGIRIQSPLSYH